MNKKPVTKILFVCLGNICRSPMAETIFNKIITEHHAQDDYVVDSAGLIGFHAGEPADIRMQRHARNHGYNITHISRKIREYDFDEYNYIVAMDDDNIRRLNDIAPTLEAQSKIVRMTDFCRKYSVSNVPDPYYGGYQDFEHVVSILEDACNGLFEESRQ